MDTVGKLKELWKDKYSSDIPDDFVARLDCEFSKGKNEPEAEDRLNKSLTFLMNDSNEKIADLNRRLKQEEYFIELLSQAIDNQVLTGMAHFKDKKLDVNVSSLYSHVKKPKKIINSDTEDTSFMKNMCKDTPPALPKRIEPENNYEDISAVEKVDSGMDNVNNKPTVKFRGSVRDKIKMFDRSDSSSGEDAKSQSEGDYARLPSPPTVSPKPSPSSLRRLHREEYEEICLPTVSPSLCNNIQAPGEPAIPKNMQSSEHGDISLKSEVDNCSSSKQEEDSQALKSSHYKTEKKTAPPVPHKRSKLSEFHSSDVNQLKQTDNLTPRYSDSEPHTATPRKYSNNTQEHNANDKVQIKVHPRMVIDMSGDDEGDYCAITPSKYPQKDGKHVTRVLVASDKKGQSNNINRSDRELSKSHENLHITVKELAVSQKEFRSHENIAQSGYAQVEFSTFKPATAKSSSEESMKKLFGKKTKDHGKNFIDRLSPKGSDEEIKGHSSQSLSQNNSDEECISGGTILIDFSKMQLTAEDLQVESKSPEYSEEDIDKDDIVEEQRTLDGDTNRKRNVPDYEKWNFQSLLTKPGVSVAENVSDDDEIIYDNVPDKQEPVSGQSDDSGVCEAISNAEDAAQHTSFDDDDVIEDPTLRSNSGRATTSVISRTSTASCVTVDGDHVFLHRSNSVDGYLDSPICEEPRSESYFSMDDNVDKGEQDELEETLKPDTGLQYGSAQLRMRHLVVKGILESEKSYLHVIDQLVKAKMFLQSLSIKPSHLIAPEDVTTIFYKMDEFYTIHKTFVSELEAKVKNWSDDQQIAEAVKKLVVYFKGYEEYVHNYQKALETIRKYQRNEEARTLLEEQMENFKGESLKLEDVLLKPVQRIQTNHLVLYDLIKHTPESHPDYLVLQKALKLSEENLRVYNSAFHGLSTSQEGRQLVKSGFMVEVSKDKKGTRHLRYVFLFTDILICTKHKGGAKMRDVSFKFVWSLPLHSLQMHIREGSVKYELKESLEELKFKIGNLKVELREEMLRADINKEKHFSLTQKKAVRNVEKLKKKIQEQEASLVEGLPRLPLNLTVERFAPRTFLFPTDYEREEWREAIESQRVKCQPLPPVQLSTHDCEQLINATKLHTPVNGIGTVLLKKDEEMLTGSLNVTIHKMQGLTRDKCDVYCCLEMDSYGHFYKKAQTRTCRYEADVSWNQDFELDLDGSQTLRILCYQAMGPDEGDVIIAKCALELSLSWLNSKFNEKTISMNDVSLTISIRHTPASKTLKRTHSKQRNGIFGVKIANVTRRENKTVPSIVTICIEHVEKRGLDEIGIYRVSGVTSDIQQCKKLFDKNPVAANNFAEEADIHTITGVLKLYFRELPEPLFTDSCYQSFVQTNQLQNEETKEKCMLELLHGLPDANYYTIVCMLEHLVRVAKRSAENKMSLSNLATIFGPTLMHPAVKETDIDPMVQMARAAKDAGMQTEIIYYFLKLANSGKNLRRSAS
ncbi:active breakpoint cluster region-related protein-like isoform X21 [Dreissena polymorpha]|nr:active breakpoint cluster region-related protein-like isoform X18 [Dreissena polymorpha]XP_052270329.1 active breakpoint cluster region-related protein-like isoform X19 [Dreissena polymorpha]XP_052270330.1 active breakpoint cluster region-related protein-like isoform X20 [Dreissena polymorpha]XP_052270331.1 active breakpoint cluster region-related protein-like isoform X21 [Dreissena polymorpha]